MFVCHKCGEEFGEKHPATAVVCPECKAKVGSPCVRPSGHNLYGGDVHIPREALAVEKGFLSKT